MLFSPHHVYPKLETVRVIFAVRNFAAVPGVSHIGLGVTATTTMKTLRRNGINAETWACKDGADLAAKIEADVAGHHDLRHAPITHVIVSAPSWVMPEEFSAMCIRHHNIEFVQLNHSGVGFLSIDRKGIRNIRACLDLTLQLHNMRVAGNNRRFTGWVDRSFDVGIDCLYLPNLYDVRSFVKPYVWPRPYGHMIKIGSFGAWRPWKNQLTAALAAVQIANNLGVELELYVNTGRTEGYTGQRMGEARQELFDTLRGHTLIEVPWERWAKFRHTVGQMNLLLQPSYSETFNVTTVDGIAQGVATVGSEAIEWLPDSWKAEVDDPGDMVKVGLYLLNDKHAVEDARNNLIEYAHTGLHRWCKYLNGNQPAVVAP
jgi:glycosyltransferase involved in cell wall biosynthesis